MASSGILQTITNATRLRDWRFSFVPFIIGCVYLWLWWFRVPFSAHSVWLLLLSLLTTAGFAALGYLINEWFDRADDARAGKLNKLAYLPPHITALLFAAALLLTFLPWLYLPSNLVSWLLIAAELSCFLLYSLPFPRLKRIPLISNVIDACYAYVIPVALSFYTFRLASANPQRYDVWLISGMALLVFVVGIRNILIHQVDDVFRDQRSGITTLPMWLGPARTAMEIALLIAFESGILFLGAIALAWVHPLFLLALLFFAAGVIINLRNIQAPFQFQYLSITPYRHITDLSYQFFIPLFALLLLCIQNHWWLLVVPLHLALTMPAKIYLPVKFTAIRVISVTPHYMQQYVKYPATLLVNYSIYYTFRLFGVDLIKRRQSAASVIADLFKRKRNA